MRHLLEEHSGAQEVTNLIEPAEAKRMYQEIVQRPGIDLVLKKEAQKRIAQLSN